jgi:hypothetical protein
MKTRTLHLITLGLCPAAMLALTSCSSSKPTAETTSAAVYEQGVPGGVVVETSRLTATVSAIDLGKRKVTIVTPDGEKTSVKCGPDVINFDQIRVGDQVKVTVTEQLAVCMAADAPLASDGEAALVALAPKGAKPGGLMASTVQMTAKIKAINLKHHKATLQFPDGKSKTFAVRKDVDLTQRKVGEEVMIRATESIAISVEKP